MKSVLKFLAALVLSAAAVALQGQPTNYINNPTIQGKATIGSSAQPVSWVVTPIALATTVINTASYNNTYIISTNTAYTYSNSAPVGGAQFGGTWTNTGGSPIFVTLSTGTTFSYGDQANITGFWVLSGGTESMWFGYDGVNTRFTVWGSPVAGNSAPYSLASATTTSIQSVPSANLSISGTTTITSFGTGNSGTIRNVTFTGILTLTYNASSLILPGAANITTAVGDYCTVMSLGSSNWVVTSYTPASGKSVVPTVVPHSISFNVVGNGGTISTGTQVAYIPAGYAGTIQKWKLTAYPVGSSIALDIFRIANASSGLNVLPTASIVGSGTKPSVTTGVMAYGTPSDWVAGSGSITLAENDNLTVSVFSSTGTTYATLTIWYQ